MTSRIQSATSVVVVAGDQTMDWNLARWGDGRAELYGQRGGAALVADILESVGEDDHWCGPPVDLHRAYRPYRDIAP